ncbi:MULTISPECIES: endonuclease [Pseudoalteromonas]|uniref:Endonuclease I n=1 Tax=Pseudoalteromonas amylolytica TaxID=1859457 RepID=A0A1S1MRM4_9GAMM|nr:MULTISPECIES: endonuclease [Pseudoalteromonas]OHU85953.1 endonuclease I [Pseudoalteromonas sp. JW3]OHU89436.1 endonuclease I [Pseudoalteromonas amylolytica]
MKHGKTSYKQKLAFALSAALCSQYAAAQVSNGDFENWQQNQPTGWTTIDSGIAISATSNVVKTGQTAAQVTVTTGTQSSTDLQQLVAVQAGQTYTFSTWVYHTEGGVKARLVVDGYHGYSDPFTLNQWQQISHSYTASTDTSISVGLRFYDGTGFDGNEVVYIDDFQPTTTTTPPPTGCQNTELNLSLTTDHYGSETSWTLTNSSNTQVASGNGYASNTTYNESLCVVDDSYTFTMLDSYGDGMCCSYGNGSYSLTGPTGTLASGSSFTTQQQHTFTIGSDNGGGTPTDPSQYYASAAGLTGFALKSELHSIISNHQSQGYSAIWQFIDQSERDIYFENDNSVLDRYSERPNGSDAITYVAVTNQCGTYSVEGDCYNREHSFPKSWFGGKIEPMNSDIHHIFATDGYVNAKRSNYPFGEVASATYTSSNGSRLGSAASSLNYSGTVFEPIDQFKGDFARAYFYMATRYEDVISTWQNNTEYSNAVLDGSASQVFEPWVIAMLKRWHEADPVDAIEQARNQAAYEFQGNRNPFVDHPEFVQQIW